MVVLEIQKPRRSRCCAALLTQIPKRQKIKPEFVSPRTTTTTAGPKWGSPPTRSRPARKALSWSSATGARAWALVGLPTMDATRVPSRARWTAPSTWCMPGTPATNGSIRWPSSGPKPAPDHHPLFLPLILATAFVNPRPAITSTGGFFYSKSHATFCFIL